MVGPMAGKAFRDKSSPKVGNDPFLLNLTPNFLDRYAKPFLSVLNAETLRKPILLLTFRYEELSTQTGISLVHF